MNDFREDPLTGRRVLLAEHRAGRPNEFRGEPSTVPEWASTPRPACVFCPGNESQTPGDLALREDGVGRWQVRVVPNKFPAVGLAGAPGVHEVIIESRRHDRSTAQLSQAELAGVLEMYAQRLASAAENHPELPYRLIFKNVGHSAGASLEHLHSQVIALPEVPPLAELERTRIAAYQRQHDRCGWCDRIAAERAAAVRIVADAGDWVAFCPVASRQPYETWILPTEHHAAFESLLTAPGAADRFAGMLLPLLEAIEAEIGPAGYNVIVQTSGGPNDQADERGHWRIEIVPRVASLAGMELATGLYFNVLSPERAARTLRARIGAFSLGKG